jgi:tRNA pseudouridine55 synthase
MEKIFAVWKPKGPTSHDIVNRVRRMTGERRVGHAGTLDPLAEGILVIAVGREATKTLGNIVGKDKEYLARIKLGEESSTDDEEGDKKIVEVKPRHIVVEDIQEVLRQFMGEIFQTPPVYSAVKVSGKPAHRRVRKGEKVELAPRKIFIREIELLSYHWPHLELRVVTGPGVYIRALARDVGRVLGVGGYLAGLVRTRIGEFTKDKCLSI